MKISTYMRKPRLTLLATCLSMFIPAIALADSVNTVPQVNEAKATSLITVLVQNMLWISSVGDINFNGSDFISNTDQTKFDTNGVCIFNNFSSNYKITATSQSNGAFKVVGPTGSNPIPYTVTWYPNAAHSGGGIPLAYNSAQTFVGASPISNCGGTSGYNANFGITVGASAYNSSMAGTYTDTLLLTLDPP